MRHAQDFFALAREREGIRRQRLRNARPPWTTDQVFATWRFCNVHREHDRTTTWFRDHVRSKVSGYQAIEACVVFRWFNRIETAERVEDLLLAGWDAREARRRLAGVAPLVTGAYVIKTPDGQSKLEGILWCITKATALLPKMVDRWGASLASAWADLCDIPFLGQFMAYEVVSDLRWTDVLREANDVLTWASAGPGCARGLGYVVDGNIYRYGCQISRDQTEMVQVMRELLALSTNEDYWPQAWDPWEMREAEHWACETAKYQAAVAGERLKRRYVYREPTTLFSTECPA